MVLCTIKTRLVSDSIRFLKHGLIAKICSTNSGILPGRFVLWWGFCTDRAGRGSGYFCKSIILR